MKRNITWVYDDSTDTLSAEVQRQDGTGSDVVWSITDTTPPSPWVQPPFPLAE